MAITTKAQSAWDKLDAKTKLYIQQTFGADAAILQIPGLGDTLLQGIMGTGNGLKAGLKDQTLIDWVKTNAIIPKSDPVNGGKNWWGTYGAAVGGKMAGKITDPTGYQTAVAQSRSAIEASLRASGQNLDSASIDKIAEHAYLFGDNSYQIDSAINSQAVYNDHATTGTLAQEQSKFIKTMADYGIPIPTDPAQLKVFQDNMKNLVSGSLAPGATDDAFTTYAKEQSKLLYPWMSGAIDAGVTPKAYLSPIITNVANTLGINANTIDITNPKWSSLFTTPDKTGARVPSTFAQIDQTIKTDPQYGYDYSPQGRQMGADLADQFKSLSGF
jgi:hypothetical protein